MLKRGGYIFKDLGGYRGYRELIDKILFGIERACGERLSYNELDRLIWYYFKGSREKIRKAMSCLPKKIAYPYLNLKRNGDILLIKKKTDLSDLNIKNTEEHMKILFQGDSITDAGRSRENDVELGRGYPMLVKAQLGCAEPGQHVFLNRGVSGNRIVDLYARIKSDIINLKPDFISILIGVNDVWHEFSDNPNGVSQDKFYRVYSMLIEELREALPDARIMILEPFVLRGTGTLDNWESFREEVLLRAAAARRVAEQYGLPFVPLQVGFDSLYESAPMGYWLADGVHPTPMGHEYIKTQWLKAFYEVR